jgi:hypothetical protein
MKSTLLNSFIALFVLFFVCQSQALMMAEESAQSGVPQAGGASGVESSGVASTAVFTLKGQRSGAQYFNRAKLVRCKITAGTSFSAHRNSCDLLSPIYADLNQPTRLKPGFYILGFENSIYPGFLTLQAGQSVSLQLNQISLPQNTTYLVYRDTSRLSEQMKLYFGLYTMGQNLFSLAAYEGDGFYIRAWPLEEAFPNISNDYCDQGGSETPKTRLLCRARALSNFMGMSEFFHFGGSGFLEYAALAPGVQFTYTVNRILVAPPRIRGGPGVFVNVLPGDYQVLSAEGVKTAQSFHVASNYGRMAEPSSLMLETTMVQAPAVPDPTGSDYQAPILQTAGCATAAEWRTELRSYCRSDATEGCNRATAGACEPMHEVGLY